MLKERIMIWVGIVLLVMLFLLTGEAFVIIMLGLAVYVATRSDRELKEIMNSGE